MGKIAQTVQAALQEIDCPPSDPKDMAKAGKMLASLRALYEKKAGSPPDKNAESGFIQPFALIQARVHRGCKKLQLQELLSEETPPSKKDPPTAQPLKKEPQASPQSAEIGLAEEEGKGGKKTKPLPQTKVTPEPAGDFAVDLGETGTAKEDSAGDQMDDDEWTKILGEKR